LISPVRGFSGDMPILDTGRQRLAMMATTGPDGIPSQSPEPWLTCWMLSHPGQVRELNEDAVACLLANDGDRDSKWDVLALVADGMGGHAAGEVASGIAADTVLRLCRELEGSPPEVLKGCLVAANAAILERGRTDPACSGMGTTCTVLAVQDGRAFLAHIGDSRAYLLRNGEFRQISEDDSLVAEMVRKGLLNEDEARRSAERHVILRALGSEESPKLSIWQKGLPVCAGDAFVLCSDGLTNLVDDAAIAAIVARLSPCDACNSLCEAALAAGGTDNISVGVFKIGAASSCASTRGIGNRAAG
jgi:serine/threonine protein phosphatase PrpC